MFVMFIYKNHITLERNHPRAGLWWISKPAQRVHPIQPADDIFRWKVRPNRPTEGGVEDGIWLKELRPNGPNAWDGDLDGFRVREDGRAQQLGRCNSMPFVDHSDGLVRRSFWRF